MRIRILTPVLLTHIVLGMGAAAQVQPSRIPSMRYPRLGLQAQISGVVRLRVSIDMTGVVSSANVLSGNSVLASAAQENAKRWRFSTGGSKKGANASVELVYEFKLEGTADQCVQTEFVFESPNKIMVVAPTPH